jgi:hypothetical protein
MNEINRLWDKWAKDHSDADVDEIIAYYRKQLAMYDAGIKPKRVEAEQVDMGKILDNIRKKQGQKLGDVPWTGEKEKPKGKGLRRI